MTIRRFVAAAIQLQSTENIETNVATAVAQIRRAAQAGARLVAVPENFAFLRIEKTTAQPRIELDDPIVQSLQSLADELTIHLVLGSLPEPSNDPNKVYNTSVLIGPDGSMLSTYRKLHLFDIDIPGTVTLKESDNVVRGDDPCLVNTELGNVGLTICYDLRFPELYRELTVDGAHIILCPAAFTLQTGKDHWLPLLRARAIENQVYIIAPGQFGHHGGARHSYGKSVIIDPWGIPLGIAADGIGFTLAEIDRDHLERIRAGLPCGSHRHDRFWPESTLS